VAKTAARLEREIAQALGLPPAVTKKWKAKVAAYKRAIVKLEAGYSEDLFHAAVRARDALDKMIYEASAHVPYDPARPAHASDAIQALERERRELVSSTWERVQERGQAANRRGYAEEMRRLRKEEREVRRPYEWMRR
jgi:hypothetical protein